MAYYFLYFLYFFVFDLKGRDDEGGRGYENDEKGQDGIQFLYFCKPFYIFESLTPKEEMSKVAVDIRTMRRDTMAYYLFVTFIFLYL